MDIQELYNELAEAYSNESLNEITGKLILLYKNKNFGKIREIANKVSKYVPIEEENNAKCFSRLIMLYHPDKGELFRKTIQNLFIQKDFENLQKYAHIFQVTGLGNITVTEMDEDIDYTPEYVWEEKNYRKNNFADYDDDQFMESLLDADSTDFEKSFYNMIKIREYGSINIDLPPYYLEDFEEFEMAYCGMESLDGIEFCIHTKVLDVSNNALSDISNLWELSNLEELYLENNQIGYIDSLCNLLKLKIVDLSNNQIDDLSPLFELEQLEYVNVFGNPVTKAQIEKLKEKGIIVMN